jgi:hypothetical protein
VKRVDKELAGLATMSPAQLRDKWSEVGREGCPSVPTGLLRRLLAQEMQEKRYGRLPVMVQRELQRASAGQSAVQQPRGRPSLTPGSRLIREWNGRTIAVEVIERGFSWDGRTYRSLSEIAREVTGAHWSGPRFFGLRRGG